MNTAFSLMLSARLACAETKRIGFADEAAAGEVGGILGPCMPRVALWTKTVHLSEAGKAFNGSWPLVDTLERLR